jgi:large subunit ribosomal protein L25
MARQQISAQPRAAMGKKVKRLRREGLIPGVVYGPAVEGVQPVAVTAKDFERIYLHAGTATLLDLVVDGGAPRPVLIHEVQHDELRRRLTHVDFLAPDMRADITVTVPLQLTGESPAVQEGGILTELVTELQVRCLPDRIPHALEVDLGLLTEIGAQLTAGQLTMPAGVALISPEDELLVKVDQPAIIEEPEAEEEEEAAPTPVAEEPEPEPEPEG